MKKMNDEVKVLNQRISCLKNGNTNNGQGLLKWPFNEAAVPDPINHGFDSDLETIEYLKLLRYMCINVNGNTYFNPELDVNTMHFDEAKKYVRFDQLLKKLKQNIIDDKAIDKELEDELDEHLNMSSVFSDDEI